MSDSDLRVLQEFPGGTQTFGLVASGDSVFYGDAQGRTIGRIEPSGARTVLRRPASEGRPHGLAAAGDDALWIAEWSNGTGNRLSRVQVDGTAYDFLDLDGYGTPRNIVVAGDDLLFTIGSRLGRLCWPTHRIDVLSFPGETGWRHVESTPLAADPAGGIWIGFGGATGFIARFDLQEETWQSFEIPGLQPTGLVVGRGDEVWFTDFAHNQVGRLTVDREVEVWDRQGNPFGIAVNSSGDVWITEFSTGRLTRLDGSSGAHVESVDLPTPGCQPQNLTFDAHGALWYTGQTGVVGRFGVAMEMPDLGASSELVVRPPPVRLRDLTPTGRDLLTDLSPDATALRISISDHPSFASPPSEVTIWRYVDLPKLVAMLATRSLFFARLDTQPDPFEGSLPQRDGSDLNLDEITAGGLNAERLREFARLHREALKTFRPRALISCWHMNDYESMAMWDLYAQSGSGIAIRSTSRRLVESLHHESSPEAFLPAAYLGVVSYIDYATTVVIPNTALSFLALKRTSFAHERELRAVLLSTNRIHGGQNVLCDLDSLVESIYVAPAAPAWFGQVAQDVLDQFGLDRQVLQSDLDVDPVL